MKGSKEIIELFGIKIEYNSEPISQVTQDTVVHTDHSALYGPVHVYVNGQEVNHVDVVVKQHEGQKETIITIITPTNV